MGFLKKLTSFPKAPKGAITQASSASGEKPDGPSHSRDDSQELGMTPRSAFSGVFLRNWMSRHILSISRILNLHA